MEKIKVAFFTHQPPTSPLEHLRVVGPISHTNINLILGPDLKENIQSHISASDLVIIQRTFPADFETFKEILEISKRLKKPLVYDFDDNLFILPENHPDRNNFGVSRALLPMLFAAVNADCITVSNTYLKNSFEDLNENMHVLPNYLDDSIWTLKTPIKQNDNQSITIGYMGGDSHKHDLEMIAPALVDVKNQYSEKIRFHFYGVEPPEAFTNFTDTIWTPIKTYVYSEFVQDFQKNDIDIFIAPLVDNEFNRCKSPIKFLEYSACGAPGVFSDIPPYSEIVTDGKNGLLAYTPDEWKQQLQILINNPENRYKLAVTAQKLINEKYLMSKNAGKWKNIYQQVINQGISKQKINAVPQDLIEAITPQLQEYQKSVDKKISGYVAKLNIADNKINETTEKLTAAQSRINNLENYALSLEKEILSLKQQISSLENQVISLQNENIARQSRIENLLNEIEFLENEVLFYALSRSWRITRPIRKLNKLVKGGNND